MRMKGGREPKGTVERKSTQDRRDGRSLGLLSSLKKALVVIGNDLRKIRFSRKAEGDRVKKIDTLLDRTVRGEAVVSLDDIAPEAVPAERAKSDDPFAALVGEDLNSDLLEEIEPELDFTIPGDDDLGIESPDGGVPGSDASVLHMDLSLASDETPIAIDETNDADEVREILEAHKDEISHSPDTDIPLPDDDLSGLDNLEIEGIEIEGESKEPQIPASTLASGVSVPAGQKSVASSQLSTPAPGQKVAPSVSEPETDMLAFGTGKHEDDDLMASLKAETKVKKKNEHESLIRDLKDVKVSASDLQKELEDILKPRRARTQ